MGTPLISTGMPAGIPFGHRITVRRPVGASGGTQDRRTGAFVATSGTPAVVYSGIGDYQDEAVTQRASDSGAREQIADGTVWLPVTAEGMAASREVRVGDVVEITDDHGRTEDARVARVRELECRLDVVRVRVDGGATS